MAINISGIVPVSLSQLTDVSIVSPQPDQYLRFNGLIWQNAFIAGGSGSVTSVTAGTGLSGGTITTTGTIALANTAVTAGSYTSANITVDAQGRITSAANGSAVGTLQQVTDAGSSTSNTITFTSGTGSSTVSQATDGNWLNINSTVGVQPGIGIAPLLPLAGIALNGAPTSRWASVFSVGLDVSGTLKWGSYTYPLPPGTGTQYLCDNGTWAIPVSGDTLQQVTDAGSSTSNTILFTGTGGPSGAPVTIGRNNNGVLSNWLELNGTLGVDAGVGIAPLPAYDDIAKCGDVGLRWNTVFTNNTDMAGNLTWNGLVFPQPTGDSTKYLCNDGTWAVPTGISSGVASFNTRTGAVTLTSGDVTTALAFTPYDATNPAGYTTNTGTVTSVGVTGTADIAVSGSPITSAGSLSISLEDTTVTPGTYGSATLVPVFTVDAKGRLSGVTNTAISAGGGGTVTSVAGTGTVSGLTLTGSVTTSGSLTLGGTLTLTSGDVTTALGYTPYDATNPAGYTTNTGTVTSVGATGTADITISGSPVTTSGSFAVSLANTTVTLGTYGSATQVPVFTVDSKGRITGVTNTAITAGGSGTVTSVAALTIDTIGTDLSSSVATGTTTPVITLNVPTASASNRGALSAADWSTFNSKGSGTVTSVGGTGTVSGLTLTGSVTTSGSLTLGGTLTLTSGDVTTALGYTPASNDAGTLTGTTLAANVVSSSLTSVGTLTSVNTSGTVVINDIGTLGTHTLTTSTTAVNQIINSVPIATYRIATYRISVTSGSSYQYTEVNIMQDGVNSYINEINTMISGATLATFTADISGGNLRLLTTPTNAVTVYKAVSILVAV